MIRVQYRPMPGRPLSQSVRVSTEGGGWLVIGFVRQAGDRVWVARARSNTGHPTEVGEFSSRAEATRWLLIDGKFAQKPRRITPSNGDLSAESQPSPAIVTECVADCGGKLAEAAD